MSVFTLRAVSKTLLVLLALGACSLISGATTCLTEDENYMVGNGTFVYSTLSSEQQEALFEDFEIAYSRKVKCETKLTLHSRQVNDLFTSTCTHRYHRSTRQRRRETTDSRCSKIISRDLTTLMMPMARQCLAFLGCRILLL